MCHLAQCRAPSSKFGKSRIWLLPIGGLMDPIRVEDEINRHLERPNRCKLLIINKISKSARSASRTAPPRVAWVGPQPRGDRVLRGSEGRFEALALLVCCAVGSSANLGALVRNVLERFLRVSIWNRHAKSSDGLRLCYLPCWSVLILRLTNTAVLPGPIGH